MQLVEYLKKYKIYQGRFAKILGIHRRYLNSVIRGHVIPSRKLALHIEQMTHGEVTAQEIIFPGVQTVDEPHSEANTQELTK